MLDVSCGSLLTPPVLQWCRARANIPHEPHPHEDEEGNVYNVAVSLKKGTRYNITQVPPRPSTPGDSAPHPLQGVNAMSTFVPKNRLCYYHSFAMTPNYLVLSRTPSL